MQNQHDYVESEARGHKLLGARDACTREKVSFLIEFEDSVRVCSIEKNEMARILKYDTITRCVEYE